MSDSETPENRHRVTNWIRENSANYDDAFDMSVECAYDLDILDWCEVNGDRTFIPIWIQQMVEKHFAGESEES